MEAFYADQNELPSGVSPKISNFKIGPLQASNTEKVKIKVRVQLNLHGIVTIDSASLTEDHRDDSTARNNSHMNSEKMEVDNNVSSDVANGADEQSNPLTIHAANELRKGKLRRQAIPVSESVYGGMTRKELSQAQEKELLLTQQDLKMEQTKEKKNYLESFVYETRSKLLNTYGSFATESEREGISANLQETEDWLYEDGDDESEVVYTEKLEDLKKLVDPIENGYKDGEARAQATGSLLNCIVEYRMAVGSLPTSQRDAVVFERNKAEQWLREKTQQQDSLPKNADPILWSSEIKRKEETPDVMCKHIMRSKASPARPEDKMDHRNKQDDMPVD